MVDINPLSVWRKLLALPNESRTKTIAVAFLVSFACAVMVSSASVLLAPQQEANRTAERQARMDAMIAAMPGMADLLAGSGADSLEMLIVDLASGRPTDIDPADYDFRAAANDPDRSSAIPPVADIAGLGRRANLAPLYVLRDAETVRLVILPISAVGYQSTIHAYLALEGDLNTVAALTVIEQGETPGLGSRIEEPAWQALWPGRKLADESGQVVLSVVRGQAQSQFEVDGITGATRTVNAVANAVHFWVGEHGFGPVLAALRDGTL